MATELKRFSDAYATMTVAFYQPLTIRWVSGSGLSVLADLMAVRMAKARSIDLRTSLSTASSVRLARKSRLPEKAPSASGSAASPPPSIVDVSGRPIRAEVRRVHLPGFPDAVEIDGRIYPLGVLDVTRSNDASGDQSSPAGNPRAGARVVPTVVNGRSGFDRSSEDLHAHRTLLLKKLDAVASANVDASPADFADAIAGALVLDNVKLHDFLPRVNIQEGLSPIGIAHYYRQLYFHTEEGFGPIEEAFTIAPNETLEVVYESIRRQVHEEFIETGSEVVSESAIESRNVDEVSDKASAMLQRDSAASMSANASGSIGVYSGGASATASFTVSNKTAREQTARKLKEITKRASERVTKSVRIRSRSLDEVTSTNVTRRIIENPQPTPVSYGLRRVLRKVNVKIQELGPRLVWQLYLRNPGSGLARSRFVHFREAEPIAVPDVPPGVRPRPKGGTDTGTASATLHVLDSKYYARLSIPTTGDRRITGVTVDSVSDLEGGGKNDRSPSPRNELPRNASFDESTNTFSADVAIDVGDSAAVAIGYTYSYEPSELAVAEWEAERAAASAAITEELLNQKFQREKELITQKSKVRVRPANELRREERYEAMNRLVSNLFGRGDDPSEPTPLEIEYFHRFFDIEGMFMFMHPSWWKPRFTKGSDGFPRPAYEITDDSDPAPLGSSLGWAIQLDGDNRRNEFLNSPWYRICLPIHVGREREAIAWLAKHVEGERGYDPAKQPLSDLLQQVEARRADEQNLGIGGPDWVTVEASPGAPASPASPAGVYPIVDEFDVTVPTDGFVYDELTVAGS